MPARCLFAVNGLGLGNSTRCHAVIEHLASAGCEVHVTTSGNGLQYFQSKTGVKSVTPMEAFFYSGTNAGISGWSTAKSILKLMRLGRVKSAQLAAVVEQLRPDIVVIDSEYALAGVRRRRIPIVALNTSETVVTHYLRARHKPYGIRSHFWFVEFPDYLFHKHLCHRVISPFPLKTPTRHPKFERVGLIIRRDIREKLRVSPPRPWPSPRQLQKVVFMLSGSIHASNISFAGRELPFKVEVVGRSGQSSGNVTFHGRQLDNTAMLLGADALVINGGYSAVSEAFALRKPVFVIPVPGHAEQFVNARLVHDLGLGFIATEQDVLDQLLEMHRQDAWVGRVSQNAPFEIDGAAEAADCILRLCGRILQQPAAQGAARAPISTAPSTSTTE